jgi:hypothetical protein
MTVRDARPDPLALWGAAAQARHVGGASRLIDEDELCRIETGLVHKPVLARGGHVRAFLLAGQNAFF